MRSLDDYFPATAPGRRSPPARWLCHDRVRRRIQALGTAQQQALAQPYAAPLVPTGQALPGVYTITAPDGTVHHVYGPAAGQPVMLANTPLPVAETRPLVHPVLVNVAVGAMYGRNGAKRSTRASFERAQELLEIVGLARVADRAIQSHGAAGISDDFGLAYLYASARTLRLADGPDEVHRDQVGRCGHSRRQQPEHR